jgi:hypothetical protein
VILDYAEGRLDQLHAVLDALRRAEAKVRLLLLARTAGAWRTERVAPSPELEFLGDDQIVLQLGPLEPTLEGRANAWEQAVTALAAGLGELDHEDYRDIDWTNVAARLIAPALDGPRYRTILAVQTHALAQLLQVGDPITAVHGGPQQVLLAHEYRYWTRVADRFGINITRAARRCLVVTATLWGAATEDDAHRVVTAAHHSTASPDELTNIADWLAALYQDGQRYWSGLQPDPLAEHLIGTALA